MGPNNTNTTPTGNTTSPGNASTPAFSGPAPATNPFSSQGAIPPSGSGDIILSPDSQPANKPKKGLIIGIIIAIVVIIGITVTALIITKQKSNTGGSDSSQGTATVSSQSLKSSFESLAKVIISGDTATGDLNLSTSSNLWQLSIINNNDSPAAQATYAATLKSANETFSNNVKNYLSQHVDQDLSSLSSNSSALTDKITASVLYLRANQFTDELNTKSSTLSTTATEELIYTEVTPGLGVEDETASRLVSNLNLYYTTLTDVFDNNNSVFYAKTCDSIFREILNQAPQLINNVNSAIGGLNG